MSLADFVEDGVVVSTGKGDLTVRPLSLEDIAYLAKDYFGGLDLVMSGNISPEQLVSQTPEFAAAAIALATGYPTEIEAAKRLALGVQLQVLKVVWEGLGVSEVELGKFLGTVIGGVSAVSQGINQGLDKMGAPSPGTKE